MKKSIAVCFGISTNWPEQNMWGGITGCPMVTEYALSVLEAEAIEEVDPGSHTIFIGNVVSSKVVGKGTPPTYQYYHTVMRGKSPPKSPHCRSKIEEMGSGRSLPSE